MLGDGSVSQLSAREIEDKLSEMLNNEVIESVLRVWRAHKYAISHPQCDKYLICHINSNQSLQSKSALKAGITKVSSLVSSWFLSGNTGTSFLELYNAAMENYNCEKIFPADCTGFNEEDMRITTEYAHNEL
ncbi:hypothetical protein AAG570_009559 [Ranatra chinensis]|uniref:Uncharacterized protein n=1 Tax=Ranatra chinensis TaxID=642074 RepID=A0ABD0Z6J5_9HEMI